VTLQRQYAKLCDLRDFEDPELVAAVTSILPERDALAHIERKAWEMAMLALFLEETGGLTDGTRILAVGAGDERIVFWLANRVGGVVATDIYGEGDFAGGEGSASMLANPSAHAPFPYREDRLEVLWMDGRKLDFPDESFDVVFSLSSIEHFGSPADIARAAAEIGRVLRRGGHAFVVTECLVRLHPRDRAGIEFSLRLATLGRRNRGATPRRRQKLDEAFTPRELERRIVRPSGLRLMQPLDTTLSAESWDNLARYPRGSEELVTSSGSFYPHILLQTSRSVFTSACLPLQRPL